MQYQITFNRPYLVGTEFERMQEAVGGLIIAEGGPFTERCERLLERIMGAPHALLTSSCTHALEMSALLLDLKPGDEVVMPTFTFVSTANAYALRGARPVFADIRPDTMNLDEGSLSDRIGPRTRAIVVVHYAGVGCEMDEIERIAEDSGVTLIEDNAHGLFGSYHGRKLGTFGALATQSFHETKNLTCGKGGALLLNGEALFEQARSIRNKGTNRDQFFEGQVDKYTWVALGSSYLPPDILSAFLLCQLEARDHIQERRRNVWERYRLELSDWANSERVQLPTVPDHVGQSYHMFYLLLPTAADRTRFIAHLAAHSMQAVFHYVPLNLSPMGEHFGGKPGDCPVAEDVSRRLVRLPFFTGMNEDEQALILETIQQFHCD